MNFARCSKVVAFLCLAGATLVSRLDAQASGTSKTGATVGGGASATTQAKTDTTVAPKAAKPKPVVTAQTRNVTRLTPPLSPRRAFLYSAMLPGFGQSRLDRGTSGALFASVELAAFAMVRRSRAELREVRRYRTDTLPGDFTTDGATIVKSGSFTTRFSADLEKTRRLHVEDWVAAMAFDHLFAGADAFVAAQLWDVPVSLSAIPRPDGAVFVATIRF